MSKKRDDRVGLCFCHPNTKENVIKLAEKKEVTIPPDANFVLVPGMEEGVVIVAAATEFEKWLNSPRHSMWMLNDQEGI